MNNEYGRLKKKALNQSTYVDLDEINELASKYFDKTFSHIEAMKFAKGIATGRISSVVTHSPFIEIIRKNPNQKVELIKLAKEISSMIIFYVRPFNQTLYENSYVAYNTMTTYRKLVKELHQLNKKQALKDIVNSLNPEIRNQNIYHAIISKSDLISTKYMDGCQEVTEDEVALLSFYDEYYKHNKRQANLLLDQFIAYMDENNIEVIHDGKNANINMLHSYFNYFRNLMNENKCIKQETIHRMESLHKDMKVTFGKNRVVREYAELIQELKDYAVVFEVEEYDGSVSFLKFCADKNISLHGLLTRLERMNKPELLQKVKESIEEEQAIKKEAEEQNYEFFVQAMKAFINSGNSISDLTLAHYYSLTNISLSHMINRLEKDKEKEVFSYLFPFYSKNRENERNYNRLKVTPNVANNLEAIKHKLNYEKFPKRIGIFNQALDFALNDNLELFTKQYFLEDFKKMIKKKEKVR